MAAFAAAPVNAQEAGGGVPVITPEAPPITSTEPPPTTTVPPPPPPSDSNPTQPTDPPPPPPSDSNPTPPPPTDPPVSDPGSGEGSPGPSDNGAANGAGGGTDTRQQPQDQFTSAMAGPGTSAAAPSSSSSGSDTELTGASGDDTWLGQDTFVVNKATGAVEDDATVPTISGRLGGMLLVGATSHAKQIEAEARQRHEMAQVTDIGSGPPGTGIPLPGDNPFFNLLSGPGGIAAGMMLASMLAVLGAAFLLPRDRLRAFRMPTVTWRPLAYVPPIELPG
jgi:hypothetical protein